MGYRRKCHESRCGLCDYNLLGIPSYCPLMTHDKWASFYEARDSARSTCFEEMKLSISPMGVMHSGAIWNIVCLCSDKSLRSLTGKDFQTSNARAAFTRLPWESESICLLSRPLEWCSGFHWLTASDLTFIPVHWQLAIKQASPDNFRTNSDQAKLHALWYRKQSTLLVIHTWRDYFRRLTLSNELAESSHSLRESWLNKIKRQPPQGLIRAGDCQVVFLSRNKTLIRIISSETEWLCTGHSPRNDITHEVMTQCKGIKAGRSYILIVNVQGKSP